MDTDEAKLHAEHQMRIFDEFRRKDPELAKLLVEHPIAPSVAEKAVRDLMQVNFLMDEYEARQELKRYLSNDLRGNLRPLRRRLTGSARRGIV